MVANLIVWRLENLSDRGKEFIDLACQRTAQTVDEVLLEVTQNRMQAWEIRDGELPLCAYLTRIHQASKARYLEVVATGGSRIEDWENLAHEAIIKFARENKCEWIEMTGRSGWKKKGIKRGWKQTAIVMRLEL